MDIEWNNSSILELNNIVSYLKKNRIGEILEYLGNYFIEKHLKFTNIEDYSMGFADNVDVGVISDGEYKLAFICELSTLHYGKLSMKKRKVEERYKKHFKSVYGCLSYMIKYCIVKNYQIQYYKVTFEEFYLNSLLKGLFIPDRKVNDKNDPLFSQIGFSYQLVSELIEIENQNPNIIFLLTSLIAETENFDISILSSKDIRNIKHILKTKRTLFVRCLLVLTFEILKISKMSEGKTFLKRFSFSTRNKFTRVLNSPLNEVIIFITANNIKKKIS